MLTLTDKAQGKVKEILDSQPEPFAGLRVQVVGGGCSGFQYHMGFEKQENSGDEVLEMNGFRVFVDRGSSMYLDGTEIDWVEALTGSGFKFNNPNVKSTCGCGESFQA
ncbi:MAG: iron-sulfur cluster assembly accessory protein [Acidobacteria bacterium]|nr:iron-sulfur cluster assembly accessory protein [Acidobacteriota bacterium]MCI0624203.1 iron-sulfur cluster assembly accessory protein [Acidobacteriota bacterium]MCI0720152.1 iron-sulfur cluster assembly accessory protein [Acidobacteriota bacterium]